MIGARRIRIAQRRERLVVQGEVARERLAQSLAGLEGPARLADRGAAGLAWLRDRPWLVGIGMFALTVLARRRAFALVAAFWQGWRLYRWLRGFARGNPHSLEWLARAASHALGWWNRRRARRAARGDRIVTQA
jgi:hypothetical protein